ncbi:hypothetical protein BAGA_08680 [Bacillus gaemokensis]|uniref:Uncharacterized protein n=1 Tax=Bacillus gaemokensis TaxID=574375 RepID=A0A073K6Y5_9BACI|nr:hypothetical protein BAGA_08680 [Bacillus gaemokensis]
MHQADADAMQGELADGIGIGRLQHRPQCQALVVQRRLQAPAAGVLGVERDEGVLGQVAQRDAWPRRQRMAAVHGDHARQPQELRVFQARHRQLVGHQAEVELPGRDLLQHLARAHDLERHLDAAVLQAEGGNGARHEAGAQRRQRTARQAPDAERFQAADAVLDQLEAGEAAVHFLHQRAGLLGRHQPAAHALEQAQFRRGFQLADGLAHRRLRNAQQGGSLAGGAGLHHGPEDLDLAHVHL